MRFLVNKKVHSMASPSYYRRQCDLCLQLALLQADPQMTVLLVGLATELRAKADEAAGASASAPIDPPDLDTVSSRQVRHHRVEHGKSGRRDPQASV